MKLAVYDDGKVGLVRDATLIRAPVVFPNKVIAAPANYKLIEYPSHVMTLYPGDLFSTGTPDGVGPLEAGDEVTIEIERIGRMSVRVELRKR